jgi:hypothetical protein
MFSSGSISLSILSEQQNTNSATMMGSFRQRQRHHQVQEQTAVAAAIDNDVCPPEFQQQQQQTTRKKNRFKLFSRRHQHDEQQQQQQQQQRELATAHETNISEVVHAIRDSSDDTGTILRRDDSSGLPLRRLLSNQRKAFLVYQQRQVDDQKSLKAIQKLLLQVPIVVPAAFHEDETSISTLVEEEVPQRQQCTYAQQQSIEQHQHQQPHDNGEEYILRRRADDGDEKLARFLNRQSQAFQQQLDEEEAPPLRTETSHIDSNDSNSDPLQRQSNTKASSTYSIGSFRTNNRRVFHNNSSRTGRHDLLHDQQPSKPQRVFCQCCYRDIAQPAEKSLTCSAVTSGSTVDGKDNSNDKSHSFCTDCVKRYVESWVFGGAFYTLRERDTTHRSGHAAVGALPCLSGTCTEGWFTDDTVSRVVSAKVAQQYQEKLVSVERVKAVSANTNSNSNPLPSSDWDSAVDLNSNVKLDKMAVLEQSYRQAEEALTYAKMRQCPYCKVSFLKESDSCNKMTCPSCRNTMCYICRKPVERRGYEHFCQHSYDSCSQCNKCPLWTLQDDARDREHLRQVAVEHANRVWGESLLRDDQHEIRLDVDKLLDGGYVYCREIGNIGNAEIASKTTFEI